MTLKRIENKAWYNRNKTYCFLQIWLNAMRLENCYAQFEKNLLEKSDSRGIYKEEFVENLFNRMSKTYGITNYISSFGFTERWRIQCVNEIDWKGVNKGYDLMSGMGESWGLIMKASKGNVKIEGIDISKAMNQRASEKLVRHPEWDIQIKQENILDNNIESGSADFITSTFGLKTFSPDQLSILAKEISRILKKGGQVAMIEISEPKGKLFQTIYMFYLKIIIPIIGLMFTGNSSDYKMLGVYCRKFGDSQFFKEKLENESISVQLKKYFFGCATGIVGIKK